MSQQTSRVFLSHVREDAAIVDRLAKDLSAFHVDVWLDRQSIAAGARWKQAIRRAIRQGSYFIACFSDRYKARPLTYMNEEITLAIEILRQRPTDTSWFLPVKLSPVEIEDRDIGPGETLADIQCVNLYEDWENGIQQILRVVRQT